MTLLFVTDKIHGQNAFVILWAKGFAERGYTVELVLLEDRRDLALPTLGGGTGNDLPFTIHSLGKERGDGRARQAMRFQRLISSLDYDRVLVHGAPIWGLLGAWNWVPRRIPVYLWYTHYTMQPGLWLLGRYGKRLFCATPQSLPQFDGSPKKVVTGHGIDTAYWPARENVNADPARMLCVHRLSRSKRVETLLRAMTLLPDRYTLEIWGNEPDPAYAAELRALSQQLSLTSRVRFMGSAPSRDLPRIYAQHRLILNLASETIDKTMLEAMTCGCYPVVTPRNADAIGIPAAPAENAESIAAFVERYAEEPPIPAGEMQRVVAEQHSLGSLIDQLDAYIRPAR